jgi:hypothetical protein
MGASIRPETRYSADNPFAPHAPAPRRYSADNPFAPKDEGGQPAGRTIGDDVAGFTRALGQGATFGFGDELEAAARAPFSERTYGEIRDDVRHQQEGFAKAHPVANFAGETAGAIGGALLTGGVVGATVKGTGMTANALRLLAGAGRVEGLAPTAGRRIVRGVVEGAAQGALSGIGSANGDLKERAAGAVMGGALGGAGGAVVSAVPGAVRLLTGGTRKNVQSAADRLVTRALVRDATSPAAVAARATAGELKDPQLLLDAAGENTLGLARAVQSVPGGGKQKIAKALQARADAQGERIVGALEGGTGLQRPDVYQLADDIIARRKATADPLYQAAREAPPLENEKLFGVINMSPALKKAHERAIKLAREEGVELPSLTRTVEIDGQPTKVFNPMPVRAFDYLKRGTDMVIRGGMKKEGLDKEAARLIRGKLADALEEVDREVPVYAQARQAFAGESQLLKSLELGRNALKEDARLSARQLRAMSDGEKETFRLGLTDAIRAKMDDAADGADLTRKIFGSTTWRKKVRNVFPDDASFESFARDMAREADMARGKNVVLGGSPTARIQAEQGDVAGTVVEAIDPVRALARGNPIPLLVHGARAAQRRATGMNAMVADATATRLLTPASQLGSIASDLTVAERKRVANLARERQLARLFGTVSGLSIR